MWFLAEKYERGYEREEKRFVPLIERAVDEDALRVRCSGLHLADRVFAANTILLADAAERALGFSASSTATLARRSSALPTFSELIICEALARFSETFFVNGTTRGFML